MQFVFTEIWYTVQTICILFWFWFCQFGLLIELRYFLTLLTTRKLSMSSNKIVFPNYEVLGNDSLSCLPHLPAALGSDLLALGILKSVTINTWGHCKDSPICLQGVECVGSKKKPKPKGKCSAVYNIRRCRKPHIPQPSVQLPLKFFSHTVQQRLLKNQKQTPKPAHLM